MRVFLDSSVLFSAIFSTTGHARDLLYHAAEDVVKIVLSQDVLDETERNLQKKSPNKLPLFTTLIALIQPEIVDDPTPQEVAQAAKYTVEKDAPIVAAAIKAKPDFLVTYDEKDLLKPPEVTEKSGLNIVRPDVLIQRLNER